MGLLLCFCCGRQREIKPIKRGISYFCSNCGAKHVRIIRSRAHASYISWADKDGIDAEKARHELYAGLRGYAERRGYKKAWIGHKFKQIFGQWPNGEGRERPAPATNGLLRWVKQQNSIFAKRKRAEELSTGIRKEAPTRLAGMGDWISMWQPDNVDDTSSLMKDDDWGVKL